METSISYVGGDYAFFSSDERKWRYRIAKLANDHPDDVTIISLPEENDGCIYAKIPANWLRIQPKMKREISDERRLWLSEQMRKMRSEQR